jgi:hypothetical protein
MNGLDSKAFDEVTSKLDGLIGVFELIVNLLSGSRNHDPEKRVMLDFAFFISRELQGLYKTMTGFEYYD